MARVTLLLWGCLALAACGGGGGGDSAPPAPTNLAYATTVAVYDTEMAIAPNSPSWDAGTPTGFSVAPALPAGLALDPTTGVISGTTTQALSAGRVHTVTASNAGGAATADLTITVGVLDTLATGFSAEVVADGLATPVKFAIAPDGTIFFNELGTGDTRILRTDGTLQAAAFAHTDVLTSGHQGLLGLVLHPDFTTNGWVYVMPVTQGIGPLADRSQVLRYTWVPTMDAGTNETLIVDDLPFAAINNGGDLVFGIETPSPHLYVSVGDAASPSAAQTDGERAGRVLRYTDIGGIPGDNPIGGDPEWCRGLRNTFALAIQPTTGDLFGADNGDLTDDELNYLNKGKNFEWGGLPPMFPPGDVGIKMRNWFDVIVPTALVWHDGTGWGAAYANDLFMTSYTDQVIRRFQFFASPYIDIDSEEIFATFRIGGDHKPLDIQLATDGSLYVSTFTGIYRIFQTPP